MKKLLKFVDNNLLKIGVFCTFIFVALYPKLPSIHIIRTYVYIRLEDFIIAAVVILWLIQLSRRKVRLLFFEAFPIVLYWVIGFISLVVSLIFIGPHLTGFFPHLAILEYGRRIEYMILFFVAFSTIRSTKDVRDYVILLCITVSGIVLYGFGQRYYLYLWEFFPKFFEKFPYCFPSFQTGNEEFAKGLALCLPKEARIPSTFGGHYDLGAYLVVMLPILLGIFFSVKRKILQGGLGILFLLSLVVLLFTASRVSFFSYLVGVTLTLIFLNKKRWLIPVFGISIVLLLTFSGSTAKRLFETFRIVNVITNNQGQVVGVTETTLPTELKNKVSKTDSIVSPTPVPPSKPIIVAVPPPAQNNLPTGSSFITLPQAQAPVVTTHAVISKPLTTSEALRLKLANGGVEISTISGSFLIQKALVYDISFTTRSQAEWPTAWAAFINSPFVGKGYSTITLATDNDYLRLLGETGALGFLSFLLIFLVFGIFLKETMSSQSILTKGFTLGLAGGVIGLFANASLIDVFEASKVAESLWILLGIGIGALSLEKNISVTYLSYFKKIFLSHVALAIYLLILVFIVFGGGLTNFFIGDDFVWLKWAATATPHALGTYFINAQGFFYRPLDKVLMYCLYTLFSFQPYGYHVFDLFIHFLIGLGVYLLGLQIFKRKLYAFLSAVSYVIFPIQAETVFWISTISISLSSLMMIYSLISFIRYRSKNSFVMYLLSLLFALSAVFSYEAAVILPILFLLTDSLLLNKRINKKILLSYVPFVLIDLFYLFLRSKVHVVPVSGDYSYNIMHLLPNSIGNFLGYVVVTFFGERALSYQMLLRQSLKVYALPIAVILLIILVFVCKICFEKKDTMFHIFHNQKHTVTIYGILFAVISLLPFLGLGNMSERYGYFASIGFAIALISMTQLINIKKRAILIASLIIGVFLFFFWKGLIYSELQQWKKASDITYTTLGYFRLDQQTIMSNSQLYIINLPIRYGDAWIFPVGFPEGLWFIYRDPSLIIHSAPSIEVARQMIKVNPSILPAKDYIFEFNKNGDIAQY